VSLWLSHVSHTASRCGACGFGFGAGPRTGRELPRVAVSDLRTAPTSKLLICASVPEDAQCHLPLNADGSGAKKEGRLSRVKKRSGSSGWCGGAGSLRDHLLAEESRRRRVIGNGWWFSWRPSVRGWGASVERRLSVHSAAGAEGRDVVPVRLVLAGRIRRQASSFGQR